MSDAQSLQCTAQVFGAHITEMYCADAKRLAKMQDRDRAASEAPQRPLTKFVAKGRSYGCFFDTPDAVFCHAPSRERMRDWGRGMSDAVPFGKYRGKPVEDMLADTEYMAWLEGQPWFRERYGSLLAKRDQDAMSRTPVHNRLQALFLDPAYQRAFLHQAGIQSGEDVRASFEVIHHSGDKSESYSCDVLLNGHFADDDFRCGLHKPLYGHIKNDRPFGQIRIEIKPSIGDDYPAVIRQMRRNASRFLFVGDYIGEGVTEAQFAAMFAASGLRVIFKRDVDARMART